MRGGMAGMNELEAKAKVQTVIFARTGVDADPIWHAGFLRGAGNFSRGQYNQVSRIPR